MGYHTAILKHTVAKESAQKTIISLKAEAKKLDEVTIRAKSKARRLKDSPIDVYKRQVLTQCDDSFTRENLKLIRELTNEMMDSLSYADKITSLTDIEFMVGTEEGMSIEQIVPEMCIRDRPGAVSDLDVPYGSAQMLTSIKCR